MDFQKASGHLADSRVYILTETWPYEGAEILAVFATLEAAKIAQEIYLDRAKKYSRTSRAYYDIEEREVLDQAPISEGQGPKTTAVGEGLDPDHVPESGT